MKLARSLAEGRSLRQVAAAMADKGHLTAGGQHYSPNQIKRWLREPSAVPAKAGRAASTTSERRRVHRARTEAA